MTRIILILTFVGASVATGAPSLRSDLTAKIANDLCNESSKQTAEGLWKKGIFDAQIQGRRLHNPTGQPVPEGQVKRKAKSTARLWHYQGYTSGSCPDGSAWILGTPSGAPVSLGIKSMRLPVAKLKSECKESSVQFVSATGGSSKLLPLAESVSTVGMTNGTIGVYCTPNGPRWLGRQMWYLVPIGDGPGGKVPQFDSVAGNDTSAQLLSWINGIRKQEKLPSLKRTQAMDRQSHLLALDRKISHDRLMLKKASEDLQTNKVELLGEDRVRAVDLREAAWMLWNSPRHRDLLLNPQARFLGIDVTTTDGLFAVITVGKPSIIIPAVAKP